MIKGILLVIAASLVLAPAIAYSLNYWGDLDGEFYERHFDPDKKKIFLIGSSQVHTLNATFIENYISTTHDDFPCTVGALGSSGRQRSSGRSAVATHHCQVVCRRVWRRVGLRDHPLPPRRGRGMAPLSAIHTEQGHVVGRRGIRGLFVFGGQGHPLARPRQSPEAGRHQVLRPVGFLHGGNPRLHGRHASHTGLLREILRA